MNNRTISFSKRITINLGNYQSMQIEGGASASLEDAEEGPENYATLRAIVNSQIRKEAIESGIPAKTLDSFGV